MKDARDTYQEAATAEEDFERDELKKLRFLLRRLRFLETQLQASARGEKPKIGGGMIFVEAEIEALEFVLTDADYLEIHR